MIEGITKTGFRYTLDEEVLDDYELLEDMCAFDDGQYQKIIGVAKKMLGNAQYETLKDHVRNEKGRVSTQKVAEEIGEILSGTDEGKN